MATIENALKITGSSASMFSSMNKSINIVTTSVMQLQVELNKVSEKTETVIDKFKKMAAVGDKVMEFARGIGGKVKAGMELSDKFAYQKAALTSAAQPGGDNAEMLRQKLFAASQNSGGGYDNTLTAFTKLAAAPKANFKGNDEIISFTELMNKAFAGVSQEKAAAGIETVTNAMAAGRLEGEDLISVMQQAPGLVQALSGYTGQSPEALMSQGVSADVLKNSMLNAADKINERFGQMPVTFQSIWSRISDTAWNALSPVMEKVVNFLRSEDGQAMVTGIINGIGILGNFLNNVFNLVTQIASFVSANWGLIAPVIWGIVGAIAAFAVAMLISKAVTVAVGIAEGIKAAATLLMALATGTATAAQMALNGALFACPITWIILGIIALIVLFYAVVAAINHFAGTSISATGVIMGYFAMMGANIYNMFARLWNNIAAFVEFFANVFTNPVYSVKRLFVNLFTNILDYVKTIASAIDMVFGSNMAGGIEKLQNGMQDWLGEKPEDYKVIKRLEMKDLDEAYKAGYSTGDKLQKSVAGIFDPGKLTDLTDKLKSPVDPYKPEDGKDSANLASTAANTGAMKDSMAISEENLVYMRDIAERDAINRFTTAEISVEMGGITNNVNSALDLDGVVSYMEQRIYETMSVAAEGVQG
ncbi:hypothetical protein CLHUN_23110 [Ruminiclostridium hungatei]|uniref:Tape measure protein N-terminal domain-containing protein n=1 Tax=Ruminiclostridium hungatei TaxID=48256 RepID=A0A1V4SIZ1_RUMHU|nr:tape measure protein [Ruminiclostridium hungatei]OPX43830.1 hypothetical protein CLHUN_23110 [Ruminiclostridium hungatei]